MTSETENDLKILNMTLKKKWFDMILSGEKLEEYREIKQYWKTRLVERTEIKAGHYHDTFRKDYTHILFKNGYSKTAPEMLIELKDITIKRGRVDWGAVDGEDYFTLVLGKIIKTENI